MNKKMIWAILGAIAILGIGLVIFRPMNDITKQIDTDFMQPITDNTTAYTATGGASVPRFNEAQHFLSNNALYILIGIMAIVLVYAVTHHDSEGG